MSAIPSFLKEASVSMILEQPFFAQIFYALENIEDNTMPTAYTDGHKRGYNKEFFSKLTKQEQVFVMCHEVAHDALEHKWRMGSRNMLIWNVACDFYINHRLIENKLYCPSFAIPDNKYKDGKKWSEEMIYDDLVKNSTKIEICGMI